jgi:hypothetical protein
MESDIRSCTDLKDEAYLYLLASLDSIENSFRLKKEHTHTDRAHTTKTYTHTVRDAG